MYSAILVDALDAEPEDSSAEEDFATRSLMQIRKGKLSFNSRPGVLVQESADEFFLSTLLRIKEAPTVLFPPA